MYDYAFGELDIIQKNYARSFELTLDTDVKKPHIIFTDAEIELLSKNLTIPGANIMYIGIYSGWRPDELCHLLLEKDVYKRQSSDRAGLSESVRQPLDLAGLQVPASDP